jgi:hypothetical protein
MMTSANWLRQKSSFSCFHCQEEIQKTAARLVKVQQDELMVTGDDCDVLLQMPS